MVVFLTYKCCFNIAHIRKLVYFYMESCTIGLKTDCRTTELMSQVEKTNSKETINSEAARLKIST